MSDGVLPACLELVESPALAVRERALAADFAPALLASAVRPVPLSGAAIERWWAAAAPKERTGLVWRIARALPEIRGVALARLADPAWRFEAGLPLALATFVVAMRLRRAHRADNTLRAWRSDWKQWRTWCKQHGEPSFNPSAAQLDRFLRTYAPEHKVATIRRLGSTLTAMHLAAGFPDPLAHPLAHGVWSKALTPPSHKPQKKKGRKNSGVSDASAPTTDRRDDPVDQAEGLRFEMLQQILTTIDTDTLIGARDAALLCTTYDLLGRRSEVVALRVVDIADDEIDDSGTALIRRSKTDQSGEGRTMFLRPATLTRIRHWLALAKITDGLVFRALRGFASRKTAIAPRQLDPNELSVIFRRRVGAVLKDENGDPLDGVKLFSGHSCRVGAAQDMAESGASDTEIMNAGRWSSTVMVARYTAKIRAKHSGMAKLARVQAPA